MTTNETIHNVQTESLTASEELSDFELESIAGGGTTSIPIGSPVHENLAEAAKRRGAVVNFKFQMATAVKLMGGKGASLESIFDPSKPLSFDAKQ